MKKKKKKKNEKKKKEKERKRKRGNRNMKRNEDVCHAGHGNKVIPFPGVPHLSVKALWNFRQHF